MSIYVYYVYILGWYWKSSNLVHSCSQVRMSCWDIKFCKFCRLRKCTSFRFFENWFYCIVAWAIFIMLMCSVKWIKHFILLNIHSLVLGKKAIRLTFYVIYKSVVLSDKANTKKSFFEHEFVRGSLIIVIDKIN